jgi:hypothetical protein
MKRFYIHTNIHTDISTNVIGIIISFVEALKYGGGVKFVGYVGLNAESLCV